MLQEDWKDGRGCPSLWGDRVLSAGDKRFIGRILTGNHAGEMPDL